MTHAVDDVAMTLANKYARDVLARLNDENTSADAWQEILRQIDAASRGFANGDTKALYTYSRLCDVARICLKRSRGTQSGEMRAREFMLMLSRHLTKGPVDFLKRREQLYFGGRIDHEDNCDILHNFIYISEVVAEIRVLYPGL